MKQTRIFSILLFLVIQQLMLTAQRYSLDSLKQALPAVTDSVEWASTLNIISWEYIKADEYGTADSLSRLVTSASQRWLEGHPKPDAMGNEIRAALAKSLCNLGVSKSFRGGQKEALSLFREAFTLYAELKDRTALAICYDYIANSYLELGEYSEAINSFNKAININQETGNKRNLSGNLNNLALVFIQMGDRAKALVHLKKAIELDLERKDSLAVLDKMVNMGHIHFEQGEFREAERIYSRGLNMAVLKKDQYYECLFLNDLAETQERAGERKKADLNYRHCRAIALKLDDKELLADNSYRYALFQEMKGDRRISLQLLDSALKLFRERSDLKGMMDSYRELARIYELTADHASARSNYDRFMSAHAELRELENERNELKEEMNRDYERRSAETNLMNEKRNLTDAKHSFIQKILIFSAVLFLILLGFVIRVTLKHYRETQSANTAISGQKRLIEEKRKEIMDSIRYARRIQVSMMAGQRYIEMTLRRLKAKTA